MLIEQLDLFERAFRSLAGLLARWWQQEMTEHELQCLSDRDLTDIGIARNEIRKLAHERTRIIASPRRAPTTGSQTSTPAMSAFRDPLANPLANRSSTRLCATATTIQEIHDEAGIIDEIVELLATR